MEAVDIVEALNQFHEKLAGEIGGQFVLQKSLLPDESFKAYKKLSLVVWYVKGSSKEITITNKEACTELAKVMLDFVAGNDYASLIYGAK